VIGSTGDVGVIYACCPGSWIYVLNDKRSAKGPQKPVFKSSGNTTTAKNILASAAGAHPPLGHEESMSEAKEP